eukprot:scaffold56554_cov64-Phaeocystis_antarctica.AAC.1
MRALHLTPLTPPRPLRPHHLSAHSKGRRHTCRCPTGLASDASQPPAAMGTVEVERSVQERKCPYGQHRANIASSPRSPSAASSVPPNEPQSTPQCHTHPTPTTPPRQHKR